MLNGKRAFWKKRFPLLLLFAAFAVQPSFAGTGGGLPWETALQKLVDSLTGPVARSIIVLAVGLLGIALAFSEGGILRTVIRVLFGAAILAAAGTFALSFFGFTSGAIF
ncbi:MAG: TrbC/VirB2 family protein [Planctomycetaceae bacterium]